MENNTDNFENLDNSSEIDKITSLKKTDKKVAIFNFILIALIFVGLLSYMICIDGIDNILNLLNSVNYIWVLAGFLCLLGVWLCDSLTLHIPLKRLYPNQKLTNSIKVTMLGQLFNNITPFSSGGQPMQAYELNKMRKTCK